jgi:hypothetical protein
LLGSLFLCRCIGMHTVVAHLADGAVLKGTTGNFRPKAPEFDLRKTDGGDLVRVVIADLKGLFFVHDLEGDSNNRSRDDADRVGLGRKVEVRFTDGETLSGYTNGYTPDRATFWVTPADPESNNDRILVVTAATAAVAYVD